MSITDKRITASIAHIRELGQEIDQLRASHADVQRQLTCLQRSIETHSDTYPEAVTEIHQTASELYQAAKTEALEVEHITEEQLANG